MKDARRSAFTFVITACVGVIFSCSNLVSALDDGGTGGGKGSGGGGTARGGGQGGAGGGQGAGGGGGDFGSVTFVDGGSPGLVMLTPTIAPSTYYEAITGLDATHMWISGAYGQIIFTDGSGTWRIVESSRSDAVVQSVYAAPNGEVYATNGHVLFRCPSNCELSGAFTHTTFPPATDVTTHVCGGAGRVYAVGTLSVVGAPAHALAYEWNDNTWRTLFETAALESFLTCDVGADGTLWLAGRFGVGRYSVDAGFTKEVVLGARGPPVAFWSAMGAAGTTRYIGGEQKQLAQRGSDGVWRVVFQPPDPRDLYFPRFMTSQGAELWWSGYEDLVHLIRGTPAGWTVYREPRDVDLFDSYEPDATTAFIVGGIIWPNGTPKTSAVFRLTR